MSNFFWEKKEKKRRHVLRKANVSFQNVKLKNDFDWSPAIGSVSLCYIPSLFSKPQSTVGLGLKKNFVHKYINPLNPDPNLKEELLCVFFLT